jgi:hypothetical protein
LISVPINIGSSKQTIKTLINSGAGGLFIDQNFAKNFEINYLDEPVKAYNMDGTENKRGTINQCLHQPQVQTWRPEIQQTFLCNWTRKAKDHSWIPLVTQIQPDYRLEKGRNYL